jgi:hypothetical protein
MSGRIWVESEMGKGSKFIFTTTFGLAAKTITAKPTVLPDLARLRMLIVDDNATNREIAREMWSALVHLSMKPTQAPRRSRRCGQR